MQLEAEFVTSVADAHGFPGDQLAEVALVGRSNVGKSSLINALTRRTIARTSAAPGKTRLANYYRLRAGRARPFYLVDLPGYGYARGGAPASEGFARLVQSYFGRDRTRGVLLVVDARHPGLASDLSAWQWLSALGLPTAVVATKVDKLTRAQRARAARDFDSVFKSPVRLVSAHSGEGLEDLWNVIVRLPSPPTTAEP